MKTIYRRRICVVTGSRAEYGLLKPVMREIQKNLSLQTIITGSHLMAQFGKTIQEIEKDGFRIDEIVKMTPREDTPQAMAKSIGYGITRIVDVLKRLSPDIVLVLGDRVEALVAAIASAYSNIPVGHIHGGDISKAGLDESTRHAITKFAHIHFPATKTSAERIIRMGEDSFRVTVCGAPGLDDIYLKQYARKKELQDKYHIQFSDRPFLLVVQHPITIHADKAAEQMNITLCAIRNFNYLTYVIYPNSDAGGRKMIEVIEKEKKMNRFLHIFRNLPRYDYLGFLSAADVLIGNSSSGIIETPSFHLPVVNIGMRQMRREHSDNIIYVDHDISEIQKAVKRALYDKVFLEKVAHCKNPYGNGKASKKIVNTLSKIKIDSQLLEKHITY